MEEEGRRSRVWRRRAEIERMEEESRDREYGGGGQEIESMEEESRRSRVWRRRAGDREYGGEQEIESMEEESRRSRVWGRRAGD